MAVRGLIMAAVLVGLVALCYAQPPLIKIPQTLIVTATPPGSVDLKAGEGKITVSWELNQTVMTDTSSYKTVKVKLCYLPESQKDRPWRKTSPILKKDKTCQHAVAAKPYSLTNNTATYTVAKDVPTAVYFVRAYIYNASDLAVAYGQTVAERISVTAITGRHTSLDVASAVFSAFSIASLAGFFYLEKKKGNVAT